MHKVGVVIRYRAVSEAEIAVYKERVDEDIGVDSRQSREETQTDSH
jgi:hypothetical protein